MGDIGTFKLEDVESLSIWAERDVAPRFVIDDDLRVTWNNEAATSFCDEVDLFELASGKLCLTDAKQRETFTRFIRASTRRASSLCLPYTQDDHIVCIAVNLINGGRPRTTGLTLRRATSGVHIDVTALSGAFLLTPAEQKVVQTLFAGFTADEVGDYLGLSVGTIRVHIRHIYDKMAISSREALFHKLLPFVLIR